MEGPRGRGTAENPANRFKPIERIDEPPEPWEEAEDPRTQFLEDDARTILSKNDSPDIGFSFSINPYRGCEHGCAYCYARPYHEYLELSTGLDFETKIFVKTRAGELLRKELSAPRYRPEVIAMSGVTDCYQPAERRFRVTRGCLEVLAAFRNPVGIVTKNALVSRDIDLLSALARHDAALVMLSVTTLDAELARRMEPRASSPARRLEAIRRLSDAGIPAGVMAAPVIPGLNDEELPAILKAAREAGARFAGFTVLRLPYGVKGLFESWLDRCEPDRKSRVLSRLRQVRGGGLNDPRFGSRMRGEGPYAEQIRTLFAVSTRRLGFERFPALSTGSFRRPGETQPTLF